MKYFLIAGEASGDLHGANLIKALKTQDSEAHFKCFGGDLMANQGAIVLKHYRDMAFMGFIPVVLNLRTILNNLDFCKKEIIAYQPDVLILIDYPGFNLKIAKYIKQNTKIPIYYYIAPKVWAWKEYRVKWFKKYVDKMFCIFPFEVDFFKKHNYPVSYIGNPTVDEVSEYLQKYKNDTFEQFVKENNLTDKPVIALLAGSRKHEIKDNLPAMIDATKHLEDFQVVLACAPSIEPEYYYKILNNISCHLVFGQTYRILSHAKVALVTSGTATLETALFRVPQVVCYKTILPNIVSWYFKNMMNTPYISLVNLIANKMVVKELFAKYFSVDAIREEVNNLIYNIDTISVMQKSYNLIANKLGNSGASAKAASEMVLSLKDSIKK